MWRSLACIGDLEQSLRGADILHRYEQMKKLTTDSVQLSKYPALNNFEKQTSVPKVYVFLGLAGLYFFLVFFNVGGEFLVNFAGFILPGYYSLDALFSASKIDDTQWLTVCLLPPQCLKCADSALVLGGLCFYECSREPDQCGILVP